MRDVYVARVLETYEARFWSKVRKQGPDECWEWSGHRWPKGYGVFRDCGGVLGPAHRVAYEMEVGGIPPGYFVMHCCDNPPCVNPRHLMIGTAQENNADRDAKGRQVAPRGSQHGMARMTEDKVRTIRELVTQGFMQAEVARQVGVSAAVVSSVVLRKTWKHIT